jgi:hypothetical protein
MRSSLFAILLVAAVALGTLLFIPLPFPRTTESPDGEFVVVVKTRLFDSLLPVMPGQSGDKPGSVTMMRKDGRSCGSAALDMVSYIYDLRWELDRTPRLARIGPIVTWNLDACKLAVLADFRHEESLHIGS